VETFEVDCPVEVEYYKEQDVMEDTEIDNYTDDES